MATIIGLVFAFAIITIAYTLINSETGGKLDTHVGSFKWPLILIVTIMFPAALVVALAIVLYRVFKK